MDKSMRDCYGQQTTRIMQLALQESQRTVAHVPSGPGLYWARHIEHDQPPFLCRVFGVHPFLEIESMCDRVGAERFPLYIAEFYEFSERINLPEPIFSSK